jgi:hypothetical protein
MPAAALCNSSCHDPLRPPGQIERKWRDPRDVLTWLMFVLAVWLGIGVLTVWLVFGAFEEPTSRERDSDDRQLGR